MEIPDANGFVNIIWPSKNVPSGGILHNTSLKPSISRENFLKLLLEESRLAIEQRAKSTWNLRCNDEQGEKLQDSTSAKFSFRPKTSKRRSLSAIRESGIYDYEPFKPIKLGEDRGKLKERLANIMAYGDVEINEPKAICHKYNTKLQLPTKKELKNEIVTHIRERVEWLAEMEYLGQGAPHRDMIKDQITEKMRALEALDNGDQLSSFRSVATATLVGNTVNTPKSVLPADRNIVTKSQGKTTSATSKYKAHKNLLNVEENVAAYCGLPKILYSARCQF